MKTRMEQPVDSMASPGLEQLQKPSNCSCPSFYNYMLGLGLGY